MKKIALVFLFLAVTLHADEYKYMPVCGPDVCLETRGSKREHPKNALILTTGPSNLRVPGDVNENLFVVGYMREVKDDLDLGVIFVGTNRRFLGPTFGLELKF